MVVENCKKCGKEFKFYPFDIKERKFCSLKCYWEAKKGEKGFWTGKKRKNMEGSKNPKWKGDKVGYAPLHQWVVRKLGRPKKCEHCGIENRQYYHWANKSGKYKRQVTDWIRLCVPCHRKYDGWTGRENV